MAKEFNILSIHPDQGYRRFLSTGEQYATFRESKILFATSDSGQQVVIKIPTNQNGAEREWEGLIKAGQAGILIPMPILVGKLDSNVMCIAMERVIGQPLIFNAKYNTRVELGQVVKQMHSRAPVDDSRSLESHVVDFIYYDRQIKLWEDLWSPMGVEASFTRHLFDLFSLPMDSYCNVVNQVFNHNDIHDGQVIQSPEKGMTLIDFEEWTEDRPLNDLGFYLFHCLRTGREIELFRGFIDGYTEGKSLSENDKLALVYNLLFISTRAVVRYLTKKSEYLATARLNHERVLNFIRDETLWKSL